LFLPYEKLYNKPMKLADFFKYCPNCQSKLKKTDHFFCSKCDFYHYLNPFPSNALILYNLKNEIVLVKRKYPPKKDYWDLPGGFINQDETVEQSLKREIKEELNLDIDINKLKYLTSTFDQYFYKKINQKTICFTFVYQIKDEVLKPTDDVSQIKFFKKENIPWKKIGFKGIKIVLERFFTSF
jgi:ADP-ribose pyrophosphatase